MAAPVRPLMLDRGPSFPALSARRVVAVSSIAVLLMALLQIGVASAQVQEDPEDGLPIVYTGYVAHQSFLRNVGYALYVMNGDGSGSRVLYDSACDDYEAALSPDGTRIAFASCYSIVVAPADGLSPATAAVTLPCPRAWCRQPSWSPDGNQIAFAASSESYPPSGTAWDLWIIDSDGTDARELYAGPGAQRHPSWSPDGKRIAFENKASGMLDVDILSVDPRGRNLSRIVAGIPSEWQPEFSPDGRFIAFARRDASDWMNIWVKNLSTGRLRRVTNVETQDVQPSWSPSSRWITFTRYNGELDDWELFKVPSIGGDAIRVGTGRGWDPVWWPQ